MCAVKNQRLCADRNDCVPVKKQWDFDEHTIWLPLLQKHQPACEPGNVSKARGPPITGLMKNCFCFWVG